MTQTPPQPKPPARARNTSAPAPAVCAPGTHPPAGWTVISTHLIKDQHPLNTLRALLADDPDNHWLLTLSYNLNHTIEPTVNAAIPLPQAQNLANPFPHIIAQKCRPLLQTDSYPSTDRRWSVDPDRLSVIPSTTYRSMVARAKEYIAAGDIYQVNLTHPITLPFTGSSASLANHLSSHTNPAMGSFTCFDDPTPPSPTRHAIISLSPETFLRFNASTNTLTTEPMKGTRPIDTDPDLLRDDPKDRAELNMIIDLMRNDLGRIAIPGTVRVTHPRTITTHHNSVHQATATIAAQPRPDLDLCDILHATFPPGSITGAPKVRAMQVINELESSRPNDPSHPPIQRGPYCGSTIALTPDGSFSASVNIRTLHIVGTPDPDFEDGFLEATLIYHAGAGIVADSDPQSEWEETLDKSAILESGLNITLPRSGGKFTISHKVR